MARDPLREIRSLLTEQVGKLWGYDTKSDSSLIVPAELREHVDQVIVDTVLQDLDPAEAIVAESSAAPLPLVARLKPRGHVEDDWSARPTPERPWPVILLHGTGATTGYWQPLARDLRDDGWCVFAPAYGNRATGPIAQSAEQVGAYVDAVLAATGAERAILIGHSQGGLVARYWMRLLGGATRVQHLVCLASPNHGSTLGGIISPLIKTKVAENVVDSLVHLWFGPAAFEQVVGSEVVQAVVDAGPDTEPGVAGYTCIATRSDSVIQPPETCFLKGDNVVNMWVQTTYPAATVLHEDMPVDTRVRAMVLARLRAIA